jgi:hypothetical protein
MDVQLVRDRGVDRVQELPELNRPMSAMTLADPRPL